MVRGPDVMYPQGIYLRPMLLLSPIGAMPDCDSLPASLTAAVEWGPDMSYGYYGYGASYQGPGAVSQLDGPGSSAAVQTAYHGSYAYESQRGGIYTSNFTYNKNDFVSNSGYTYMGSDYGTRSNNFYHDYTSHTLNSPYSDYAIGANYASYPSNDYLTQNDASFIGVYHYSGSNEYLDWTTRTSSYRSNGYSSYSYTHDTFERTDGQFDAGSQYIYYTKSVTDPYGYTSSDYHTIHG